MTDRIMTQEDKGREWGPEIRLHDMAYGLALAAIKRGRALASGEG